MAMARTAEQVTSILVIELPVASAVAHLSCVPEASLRAVVLYIRARFILSIVTPGLCQSTQIKSPKTGN